MARALPLLIALTGCIDAPSRAEEATLLINGDFEEGVGVGWVFQPGASPRIATAEELGIPVDSGDYAAEVGGDLNDNEVIWQTVDVPAGVTSLTLSFHRCVLTEETENTDYDYCNVRASLNPDQEPETLYQESNRQATPTCSWGDVSVGVTSLTAGVPIDILLISNNDGGGPTWCFYDTLELVATYE